MSLQTQLIALAQAIGSDVSALTAAQGDLSALTTTGKTSLVEAINELATLMASAGVAIDDLAGDGSTLVTWSADKIFDSIEEAKAAVKNELLEGAGAAFDTLNELALALGNDPDFATTMATELANRVRFDIGQELSLGQQQQACSNIGAVHSENVGDTDHDFVADYTAAKA